MLSSIKRGVKLNMVRYFWNTKGSFPYYGSRIFFPKNSEIFLRTIKEGIYEAEIVRTIIALAKANTEVFDIGANIGTIAIPLLSSDKNLTVISVEASPNTFNFLKKTRSVNRNSARWIIIDKAVADAEKTISFNLASAAHGAYDSINNTKRTQFETTIEIDCTTIDLIWKSRDKPNVSFIKLDIEGADLLALKGGINCIKHCKPNILMEWNALNFAAFGLINQNLFDFLYELNYSCFTVPGLNKINNLNELDLYSHFTENFLLIPN